MALAPKRRCTHPTCPNYAPCPVHSRRNDYRSEAAREWHGLYDARWRRYRLAFLAGHPLCVDPFGDHGPLVAAECVDHIRDHKGDYGMFWDEANHQALCIACNSKKAAKEGGGFGNRRKT